MRQSENIFPSAWLQPSLVLCGAIESISHPKCIFLPSLGCIRIFSYLPSTTEILSLEFLPPCLVYSLICIGIAVIRFDMYKLISFFYIFTSKSFSCSLLFTLFHCELCKSCNFLLSSESLLFSQWQKYEVLLCYFLKKSSTQSFLLGLTVKFWKFFFFATFINFHQQFSSSLFFVAIKENYFHKYLFNLFSFKCMFVFLTPFRLRHLP